MIRLVQETIRLAVLFDRIGPYHHARLDAAAAVCDVVGVEFSAVDGLHAWDEVDHVGLYDRRTLFTGREIGSPSALLLRQRLQQVLNDSRPDAVAIPGWATRGALSALRWCLATDTPAILMSDSWDPGQRRKWWTESVKRRIVSLYGSALVAGTPQLDYVEGLGIPRERIFTGYDAVDNDYFSSGADHARGSASTLRQRLQLPRHYFLATCRFIAEKNLHRLLIAYAAYRSVTGWKAWHLVLVGDGPLKEELVGLRRQLGLEASVHFVGFQQYDRLPAYYGLADAFVLPSVSETWGLVVNEAMASGLPVLVSDRCGCSEDLVSEGVNGFSFDPMNADAIRDAMVHLSSSGCDSKAMGERSRNLVHRWSVEEFASSLRRAATTAVHNPRPRANLLSCLALSAAARR